MRYENYLVLVEAARTKRKLKRLLEKIENDFSGIDGRQYEALRFLIISKMYA